MPATHIVTIVLPGSDPDDCMHYPFEGGCAYHNALDFASDCAEQIDANDWADCVIDAEGRVCDALKSWNEKQAYANPADRASITISTPFNRRNILAACRGDANWYLQ